MQTLIKRKLTWLLISEKDFRKWKVTRDKARCYIMTKGSVYHEDIAILNMYGTNKRPSIYSVRRNRQICSRSWRLNISLCIW